LPLGFLSERPQFDGKRGRAGELAPPFERGVEVGRLDDREPADVLFALRKRAVGRQHVAALDPDDGGRARGVQPTGEDPRACGLQLLADGIDVAHHVVQHLGRWRVAVGLINAEQVLLHWSILFDVAAGVMPASTLYTNSLPLDRQGRPCQKSRRLLEFRPTAWENDCEEDSALAAAGSRAFSQSAIIRQRASASLRDALVRYGRLHSAGGRRCDEAAGRDAVAAWRSRDVQDRR